MRRRRAELEKELEKQGVSKEEKDSKLSEHDRLERDYTRLQRQRMTTDAFEPLTIIGRGAFGEVRRRGEGRGEAGSPVP